MDLRRGGGQLRPRHAGDSRAHARACAASIPTPPAGAQPTCETAGVLNVIVSAVASMQVADALRILCGRRRVAARITTMDVWEGGIRQIDAPPRDPECPVLRPRASFPYLDGVEPRAGELVRAQCGAGARDARPMDLAELRRGWRRSARCARTSIALRFFVAPYEMTIFPDGRAIVKGTSDTGVARSLYARYVG